MPASLYGDCRAKKMGLWAWEVNCLRFSINSSSVEMYTFGLVS